MAFRLADELPRGLTGSELPCQPDFVRVLEVWAYCDVLRCVSPPVFKPVYPCACAPRFQAN